MWVVITKTCDHLTLVLLWITRLNSNTRSQSHLLSITMSSRLLYKNQLRCLWTITNEEMCSNLFWAKLSVLIISTINICQRRLSQRPTKCLLPNKEWSWALNSTIKHPLRLTMSLSSNNSLVLTKCKDYLSIRHLQAAKLFTRASVSLQMLEVFPQEPTRESILLTTEECRLSIRSKEVLARCTILQPKRQRCRAATSKREAPAVRPWS